MPDIPVHMLLPSVQKPPHLRHTDQTLMMSVANGEAKGGGEVTRPGPLRHGAQKA